MPRVVPADRPLIVETGSSRTRAGFAGDATPRVSLPTVVGTEKYRDMGPGFEGHLPSVVGDAALARDAGGTRKYRLSLPVEWGYVQDWDDVEFIWTEIFSRVLGVDPARHPVLLLEPPLNPPHLRERAAEILFETFEVPALGMAPAALFVLLSAGRKTGVVLDSGLNATFVVPFYEGYVLAHSFQKLALGGADLTDYLVRHLRRQLPGQGAAVPQYQLRAIAERVKREACFVVPRADSTPHVDPVPVAFPDGTKVALRAARHAVPEALFQPDLVGRESASLPRALTNAITACDPALHPALLGHLVLTGGNTLLPGLGARLQADLRELLEPAGITAPVTVVTPPRRDVAAWEAASTLLAPSPPEPPWPARWITRAEYRHDGAALVHQREFLQVE